MSRWDFRSVDAEEVQQFLGGVYTENEFKIFGKSSSSRTRIYGGDLGDIAQYNVSYSSPFTFLSETDRDSFLIISCTAGSVTFSRGRDAIDSAQGCVAPISATREIRAKSGINLAHISTLINAEAVTRVCSKLSGTCVGWTGSARTRAVFTRTQVALGTDSSFAGSAPRHRRFLEYCYQWPGGACDSASTGEASPQL